MNEEVIVKFGQKPTSKDIEDRLFWAIFDCEEKFGKDRVKADADFCFDREKRTLTFPKMNEINDHIYKQAVERHLEKQ